MERNLLFARLVEKILINKATLECMLSRLLNEQQSFCCCFFKIYVVSFLFDLQKKTLSIYYLVLSFVDNTVGLIISYVINFYESGGLINVKMC